jgi:ribosomal protein S18 acetylase RimI-like enzyme
VALGREVHLPDEWLQCGTERACLCLKFGVIGDASHEATVEGRLPRLVTVAVNIEICSTVDDEVVAAFEVLIPQLSSSNPPPSREALKKLVESEASTLFMARLDGRIVGSLTLAMFRIPTGVRAWIEDVVVDGTARGHGVGEALNRAALDHARTNGAITVDLTSRPSREAANRLYQRMGFVLRESNLYRYQL